MLFDNFKKEATRIQEICDNFVSKNSIQILERVKRVAEHSPYCVEDIINNLSNRLDIEEQLIKLEAIFL